jgi:serine-type D-Ala-D-Ala carboxypeptidase/endopeptidase (penicillin-binding protein 4)
MVRQGTGRFLVVVFLFCVSCSMPLAGPPAQTAGMPNAYLFSEAHWGILVRSLKNERVIWAKNEKLHFIPASNLKLFTTAVSLLRLGPDYRYTTTALTQGEIKDCVLNGDLIVRASGDPSLSTRFRQGGAVGVFEEWAHALVEQGIKEVRGDIVIDESLFDTQYMGTGWFWDDEPFAYSAQISAFSINDNCVELRVTASNNEGEPGIVEVMPRTRYVTIVNLTRTIKSSPSSIAISRKAGSNTVIVSGTISSLDCPKRLSVTVHGPSLYGATVLKEVLESKGIIVRGAARIVDDDALPKQGERVLISSSSPPLSVIISHINKPSHNLSAELLFRTLGAVYRGKGTTRNGARVMQETLEQAGIIPEEISIWDGSGLSRLSMVTPLQVVNLLEFMYHHPGFAYFYNSLPVAGVDGTLAARMVGTSAENNVRAKTGSSTHIGSLSGYVKKKDGEMLAFSILTNNNPKMPFEIRKLQDFFAVWLCGLEE